MLTDAHLNSLRHRKAEGLRLRALRNAGGWTQAELALQLGLHWNTVARMERGKSYITGRTWSQVASLIRGIPMDTRYAAHDDLSIYALGATPDEAIANAIAEVRNEEAQFQVTPIDPAFAITIDREGFDPMRDTFHVDRGVIKAGRVP